MNGDFRLGDWLVQPSLGCASRDGRTIHLRAKVMDLLVCLAGHRGQVVSKDDILNQVWKTEFVSESALTRVVTDLRQAFGDDADHPTVIETIPKRGYRLIPLVGPIQDVVVDSSVQPAAAGDPSAADGRTFSWSTRWALVATVVLSLGLVSAWVAFSQRAAPPILTERDTVLMADFANRTNDPVFDHVLGQALAIQLAQSPFLYFVPEREVRETLQLMRQPEETPLTIPVARAVCEREQAKVLIAGSITNLGRRYVVGLEAIDCQTGESVGRALEESADKEHVLGSLGAAASTIRRQLGESLTSIQRFDIPIQRVTTGSLEALRAYGLAQEELNRGAGHEAAAIRLLGHAVALDPEFASAYQSLGVTHNNVGPRTLAMANLRRAWDLRQRVSERERLNIEATRAMLETGEFERSAEIYRLLLRLYPRARIHNNNLTLIYKQLGLHEQALEAARENLLGGERNLGYLQLGRALLCVGRFDEAKQVLEEAGAKGFESVDTLTELYEIAFLRHDATEMEQYIARATGSSVEGRLTQIRVQSLAALGQLHRAQELIDPDYANQYYGLIEAALRSALFGNTSDPRLRKLGVAVVPPDAGGDDGQNFGIAATVLALTGDVAGASRQRDIMSERFPLSTIARKKWMPTIAAAMAMHERDYAGAINLLAGLEPYEFGRPIRGIGRLAVFLPTYVRAQAYLAAGQPLAAAVEFKKILDRPGLGLTSPILPLSRLGLARAYEKAGDIPASRKAYEEVLAFWKDADADIPIIVEARREYAKLIEASN